VPRYFRRGIADGKLKNRDVDGVRVDTWHSRATADLDL
jgi:hypothetical protein